MAMRSTKPSLLIIAMCCLLAVACSHLEGGPKSKDSSNVGVVYYLPQMQFFTQYTPQDNGVKIEVSKELAPDYSRPYYLQLRPGLFSADVFDIQLTDKGLLASIVAEPTSKLAESVTSLGTFAIKMGSLAGLGMPLAAKSIATPATKFAQSDAGVDPNKVAPILLASASMDQPLLLAKASKKVSPGQAAGEPSQNKPDELAALLSGLIKELANKDATSACGSFEKIKGKFDELKAYVSPSSNEKQNNAATDLNQIYQKISDVQTAEDEYRENQDIVFQNLTTLLIMKGSTLITSPPNRQAQDSLSSLANKYWEFEQSAAEMSAACNLRINGFWDSFMKLTPKGADEFLKKAKISSGDKSQQNQEECGLTQLLTGGPALYLGKCISQALNISPSELSTILLDPEQFEEEKIASNSCNSACAENPTYAQFENEKRIIYRLARKKDSRSDKKDLTNSERLRPTQIMPESSKTESPGPNHQTSNPGEERSLASFIETYSYYLSNFLVAQQNGKLIYGDGHNLPAREVLHLLLLRFNYIYYPFKGYQEAENNSLVLPRPLLSQVTDGLNERQSVQYYTIRVQDALQRFNLRKVLLKNQASYLTKKAKAYGSMASKQVVLAEKLTEISTLKKLLAEKPSIKDFQNRATVITQLDAAIKNFETAMQPDVKQPTNPKLLTTPSVVWLDPTSSLPIVGQDSVGSPGDVYVFVRSMVGK